MRRRKMKKSASRRLFRKTASKTKSANLRGKPMRGGWRL